MLSVPSLGFSRCHTITLMESHSKSSQRDEAFLSLINEVVNGLFVFLIKKKKKKKKKGNLRNRRINFWVHTKVSFFSKPTFDACLGSSTGFDC